MGAVLGGQDAQDGVQRADPFQGAGAPAHGFGPGEVADRGVEDFGDDFGGGAAGFGDRGEPDLALLVVAGFELVFGEAGRAQEAVEGLFGGVGAGAFAFLLGGGAFGGQALDREGQAARGVESAGAGVGQAGLDQTVGDEFPEVGGGAGLHPCGNFLGEEFDQEVRHGGAFWFEVLARRLAGCAEDRARPEGGASHPPSCRRHAFRVTGRVGCDPGLTPREEFFWQRASIIPPPRAAGSLRPPGCRHRRFRRSCSAGARHRRGHRRRSR